MAIDFVSHYVKDESILELGCVLPYYILKRSNHIVYDLMDRHPQNVARDIRDMADSELKTNVISISTIEHIDMAEYGIESCGNVSAVDVLKRITENAKRYFITFPLGHNQVLDGYVADSTDLNEVYVTRTKKNPEDWEIVEKTGLTDEMRQYGTYLNANTICILKKI